MPIVIDDKIRNEVSALFPTLVLGIDTQDIEKQIKGCAVDMRIGDIFRPGTKEGEIGSAARPRTSYHLQEGETAVIRTIESFKLDSEHAAFVFPASSVSLKGLLMTNPGHVDPGYEGHLHVTVINMSRKTFILEKGDRFLRAVLYKLDHAVCTPSTLNYPNPITTELLERLSPDFLSVDERIKRQILSAEYRARFWQILIPGIFVLLSSYVTSVLNNISFEKEFSPKLTQLEQQMKLETRIINLENNAKSDIRFNAIEEKLKAIPSNSTSK